MSVFRTIASLMLAAMSIPVPVAFAVPVTITSVSGDNEIPSEAGLLGEIPQALYTTWTSSQAYTNVSVSALVGDASALSASQSTIYAFLTTAVGSSETPADEIASAVLSPQSEGEMDTIFSDLTLAAGTYYLVMTGGATADTAADWFTAGNSVFTDDAGVTNGFDGFTYYQTSLSDPSASPNWVATNDGRRLVYSVTGEPISDTPEPGSVLTAVSGIIAITVLVSARPMRTQTVTSI